MWNRRRFTESIRPCGLHLVTQRREQFVMQPLCRVRDGEVKTIENLENYIRLDSWELLQHDVSQLILCLLGLAVFDAVFARHTKARWWLVHLFGKKGESYAS